MVSMKDLRKGKAFTGRQSAGKIIRQIYRKNKPVSMDELRKGQAFSRTHYDFGRYVARKAKSILVITNGT